MKKTTFKMAAASVKFLVGNIISAVLFVFVLLCVQTTAQFHPICAAPGYDIGNLTTRIWTFPLNNDHDACLQQGNSTGDSCTFYMAFCQPLDRLKLSNCSDAGVCQQNTDETDVFKIGGYENNPFKIDTTYNPKGFIVDFPNGGTYYRPNGTDCTLSVRLSFQCFPDAQWTRPRYANVTGVVPGAPTVTFNDTSCQFDVVLHYAGACVSILPIVNGTTPIAPPVTTPNVGTVLVIIKSLILTLAVGTVFIT